MIIKEDSDTKIMTQLQASISSLESLKIELVKRQMKETILESVKNTLGVE